MRDRNPQPDDTLARDSFSLRTMTPWQVRALTVVAVVAAIGLLAFIWL